MLPRACRGKPGFGRPSNNSQRPGLFAQPKGQKPWVLPNSMEYRQRNEVESDDEAGIDVNEEDADDDQSDDGGNSKNKGQNKSAAVSTDNNECVDGPLEPWSNECKAKLAIIDELKNESSPIHQFIPAGKCAPCFSSTYSQHGFNSILSRSS
jgi:hypothetical protein